MSNLYDSCVYGEIIQFDKTTIFKQIAFFKWSYMYELYGKIEKVFIV